MAKILAVDDNQRHLTSTSLLLENLIPDCVVVTAQSGVDGIVKAKEELPDTILLDLNMPELDGFEVCKRLKSDEATEHIPVVMLTGVMKEVESRVKGLETGAYAYLTKPVDAAELTAQIKAMLKIKKTETDFRIEKRMAQRYLDIAPTIILALDAAGTISLLNDEGCIILECNRNEVLGKNWFDAFLPEGGREHGKALFEKQIAGEMQLTERFDGVIVTARGNEKIIRWYNSILKDETGRITGTLSSGQNITNQKKMEAELESKTQHINDVDAALRVLLKKRDEDKADFQENILLNVKQLVIPYLERLRKSRLTQAQTGLIGILESNFNDIVSPFVHKLTSQFLNLTPMEIRVANLVKEGKTNKEMAEFLTVSIHTVVTHRKNLRYKLGLRNKKTNLKSYLLSLTE